MTVKTMMKHIRNLTLESDAVICFGGPHSETYLSGIKTSPKKIFLQASSCADKDRLTVEKLMNFLKLCDGTMTVCDEDGDEILFTYSLVGDDHMMWVETEYDADMVTEIQSRFDDAIIYGVDETEVYENMLELGINVEIVRKYMGDADADHMQEYCEEHGLL